jgi:CheY-like chemotaxis protein
MAHAASNRPVVLIVEDEVLLRWQAVAIVEDAGFDVVEAANGDEAIAILEVRDDVHVLFTDIRMPGAIDGLRLAHMVRTRWPPVKILAASGQTTFRADDLPAGAKYLLKPYAFETLSRTIMELAQA